MKGFTSTSCLFVAKNQDKYSKCRMFVIKAPIIESFGFPKVFFWTHYSQGGSSANIAKWWDSSSSSSAVIQNISILILWHALFHRLMFLFITWRVKYGLWTQFIGNQVFSSVSTIWWKFHFDISVEGRKTLDWKQERPEFCSRELVVLPQIQSSGSMMNSFEANARALPKKQILQFLSEIRFTFGIWIAQIYHWYQSHLLWNPDHSLRVRKSKNFPDSKIHEKKLSG